MFLLPYWQKTLVDRVSLWLTPTNTNIGTFFISRFHYHSTRVKFPKINSLSIQLPKFFSQFNTHFHIHQHNCLNLFFLVCEYNCWIFHLSSCLIWNCVFASFFQPYAWYNKINIFIFWGKHLNVYTIKFLASKFHCCGVFKNGATVNCAVQVDLKIFSTKFRVLGRPSLQILK